MKRTLRLFPPTILTWNTESFDGYDWDVCTVTVNGTLPKDSGAAKKLYCVLRRQVLNI